MKLGAQYDVIWVTVVATKDWELRATRRSCVFWRWCFFCFVQTPSLKSGRPQDMAMLKLVAGDSDNSLKRWYISEKYEKCEQWVDAKVWNAGYIRNNENKEIKKSWSLDETAGKKCANVAVNWITEYCRITRGNATRNHPGKNVIRETLCSRTILQCRHAVTAPHLEYHP